MEKEKITLNEEQLRNIHLRKLLIGEIQGPLTGKASIDKPHLKRYPEEALYLKYPEKTMYEYLYELNKEHMNDVALVFDTGFSETKITFKEMFEKIDIIANCLHNKGIKSGDKVAISFANTPESVYLIYALNKIGAVSCLVDPRIKEYTLENDLKDLDVKMYIGINDTYKKIKNVNKKTNIENIVIVSPINSCEKKLPKLLYMGSKLKEGNVVFKLNRKWSKFISENQTIKDINFPQYEPDKTAVISYTGGTTGVHKGVMLSNNTMNNLVFSHKYMMESVKRGDVFMNILPQFMIFGAFSLHLALCRGVETHLLLDSAPEHFVDNLIRINPAMAFGGPVHWETLINNPKLTENSLSNMKAPVSGGEKLSLSAEKKIDDALLFAGSKELLCNGYGASELNGSVTLKEGNKSKEGTVGILHVYDNAKIIDENGNELFYDQEGELLITSPSLMQGYYNNDEENKKAIIIDKNGTRWFKTGDLAKIDKNGDIEITGRSKILFVCGLKNVYPPEMEELINQIPGVKKCAVTNVPDKILREVPKVHIVKDENVSEENIISAIQSIIAERISDEVIPHYYEFHDNLKYTSNGKIDVEQMRKDDIEKLKENQSPKTYKKVAK